MGESKISNDDIKRLSSFGVNAAKERFGVTLDYSENSLQDLDNILEKAYIRFNDMALEGKLTEDSIKRTSKIWGCYLGAVIQENIGGYWVKENGNFILVMNSESFDPIGFVNSRITKEPHLSAVDFYDNSKGNFLRNMFSESKEVRTEQYPTLSAAKLKIQEFAESQKPSTHGTKRSYWSYIAIIICVVILGIFIRGKLFYTPNSEDAFSYTKEIVNQELYLYNHNVPGCEHRVTFYQIQLDERGNNKYYVKGAVVAGNWACVKDVSYFTVNVHYDEQDEAYHSRGIHFSNPCVTIQSSQDKCFNSQWFIGWLPGDPAKNPFLGVP